MTNVTSPIVLAAGGTAGHMFPAEALAKVLVKRGHSLVWITDERGSARTGLLSELPTYIISARGLMGSGTLGRLTGVLSLGVGVFQARRALKEINPAAVIGFGGYAAAPTMMAATHLKLPTALHEQNGVIGRANKLFAKRVDKVCLSFPTTRNVPAGVTTIHTGMPVRSAFGAVRAKPYVAPAQDDNIRIVVMGGSQGAAVFSHLIPSALKRLPESLRKKITIDQQCRNELIDQTRRAFSNCGVQARLQPFFDDVAGLISGAHLVIARSGSSTVSEISFSGRPGIFVPYPYAADNHQTDNAEALANAGGGWCYQQESLTPDVLAEQMETLFSKPEALATAAKNAKAFAISDAADRLADVVEVLVTGNNGDSNGHSNGDRNGDTHNMRGAA